MWWTMLCISGSTVAWTYDVADSFLPSFRRIFLFTVMPRLGKLQPGRTSNALCRNTPRMPTRRHRPPLHTLIIPIGCTSPATIDIAEAGRTLRNRP